MFLEKISEKNNKITFSHSNGLTPVLAAQRFDVKKPEDIRWFFAEQIEGIVWVEVNFFEPTEIFEIQWEIDGAYEEVWIEHSIDGINWYLFEKDEEKGWTGFIDINPVYVRLSFKNILSGFTLTKLALYGEEKFKIKGELISLSAKRYYPQRYFEKYELIPGIVQNYLRMLECNKESKTIKKFFEDSNCVIDVYLIFDEGDEGSGAINSYPINTVPINSGSSTTYDGLGTIVINRIAGGGAFYNINGMITNPLGFFSKFGLRFNSTIECEDMSEENCSAGQTCTGGLNVEDAKFRWEFNDPYADPTNPTTLVVNNYGEVIHLFSALGFYNIQFIMELNGKVFKGTQYVEIAPSPYHIISDWRVGDGSVFEVIGLTRYPSGSYQQPFIVLKNAEHEFSYATVIDNHDRTFTITSNGEYRECVIKVYDEYYQQYVNLDVSFAEAEPVNSILSSQYGALMSADHNYITYS